jgi:hypothetical protein
MIVIVMGSQTVSVGSRLRPFLENIFLKKFLEKKKSREILEKFEKKNSKFKLVFFYNFGILTTKMTNKMYTKLASIEINDEILKKVGGIQKSFG